MAEHQERELQFHRLDEWEVLCEGRQDPNSLAFLLSVDDVRAMVGVHPTTLDRPTSGAGISIVPIPQQPGRYIGFPIGFGGQPLEWYEGGLREIGGTDCSWDPTRCNGRCGRDQDCGGGTYLSPIPSVGVGCMCVKPPFLSTNLGTLTQ